MKLAGPAGILLPLLVGTAATTTTTTTTFHPQPRAQQQCESVSVGTQADIDLILAGCTSSAGGLYIVGGSGNLTFHDLEQAVSISASSDGDNGDLVSLSFPALTSGSVSVDGAPGLVSISLPKLASNSSSSNTSEDDDGGSSISVSGCPSLTLVDLPRASSLSLLGIGDMSDPASVFRTPELAALGSVILNNVSATSACLDAPKLVGGNDGDGSGLDYLEATNSSCTGLGKGVEELSRGLVLSGSTSGLDFPDLVRAEHLTLGPVWPGGDDGDRGGVVALSAPSLVEVESTVKVSGVEDFAANIDLSALRSVWSLRMEELGEQELPGGDGLWGSLETAEYISLAGYISTNGGEYNIFPALTSVSAEMEIRPNNTDFDCGVFEDRYADVAQSISCYSTDGELYIPDSDGSSSMLRSNSGMWAFATLLGTLIVMAGGL